MSSPKVNTALTGTPAARATSWSIVRFVGSAAATVKFWPDPVKHPMPVQVVRYYEDAWSEFAIKPGVALP